MLDGDLVVFMRLDRKHMNFPRASFERGDPAGAGGKSPCVVHLWLYLKPRQFMRSTEYRIEARECQMIPIWNCRDCTHGCGKLSTANNVDDAVSQCQLRGASGNRDS